MSKPNESRAEEDLGGQQASPWPFSARERPSANPSSDLDQVLLLGLLAELDQLVVAAQIGGGDPSQRPPDHNEQVQEGADAQGKTHRTRSYHLKYDSLMFWGSSSTWRNWRPRDIWRASLLAFLVQRKNLAAFLRRLIATPQMSSPVRQQRIGRREWEGANEDPPPP